MRAYRHGEPNLLFSRYADDWCIFLNRANKHYAETLREEIREFLLDQCGLELSVEKTKVTHVRDRNRPGQMDLKLAALERDNYQCCKCGSSVVAESSQLDHIKPVHQFASFEQAHTLDNVQILCTHCHKQKTRSERKV